MTQLCNKLVVFSNHDHFDPQAVGQQGWVCVPTICPGWLLTNSLQSTLEHGFTLIWQALGWLIEMAPVALVVIASIVTILLRLRNHQQLSFSSLFSPSNDWGPRSLHQKYLYWKGNPEAMFKTQYVFQYQFDLSKLTKWLDALRGSSPARYINCTTPCNTMQYHAIQWNSMQYHTIQSNTIQ